MTPPIPPGWNDILAGETRQPYYQALQRFVDAERAQHAVYPPDADVFNAFAPTSFEETRVLILGQDPYHDEGQAHGLAFSVRLGVPPPPSLVNIFKELRDDLGVPIPNHGCLEAWARQGVLLLNAVLTVRAHQPGSHAGKGWERFTDAAIRFLSARAEPLVFVLWGNYARQKLPLIDASRHKVITGAHPSPLSAYRGFFGSRPFSRINADLAEWGQPPIDWNLI